MVKIFLLKIYSYAYKKAIERYEPVCPKRAMIKELIIGLARFTIRYYKTH
jgi:hypothetical protein